MELVFTLFIWGIIAFFVFFALGIILHIIGAILTIVIYTGVGIFMGVKWLWLKLTN